jgi:hypothetical protein
VSRKFSPRFAGWARSLRLTASTLVVTLALVGTAGAQPAAGAGSGWWMAFQAGAGTVDGQVRVGEPSPSTPLNLKDDLGMDAAFTFGLEVSGSAGFSNRMRFSGESLFMSGSKTFDKTVDFDEGSFPPGSSPKADPRFYLLEAEYARVFGESGARSHWLLLAGVAYAYLDFRLGDQSEDFYRQEVPMPVLGAGWELNATDNGTFRVALEGFRYNHLNTGEKEGSTVYLDQQLVDFWAGWLGHISPRIGWSAGYRFFSFSQTENSSEDYNDFHAHLNTLTGSLAFRF